MDRTGPFKYCVDAMDIIPAFENCVLDFCTTGNREVLLEVPNFIFLLKYIQLFLKRSFFLSPFMRLQMSADRMELKYLVTGRRSWE